MKKLGTFLKQLREEVGLSIRQAAKKSEVTPSYLSKIEAGDTFPKPIISHQLQF